MDTMYRKKNREAEEAISAEKKQKKSHASDSYRPKVRPRETHPDAISSEQRISRNLNQLNRRLVDTPTVPAVKGNKKEEFVLAEEDRGAKVVTRAAGIKAPFPIAMIVSCLLIALVFMYMLSLYVQIEEYSHSIDTMESEIARLRKEATQLEVQLENKYDLDEVERIATQDYGMVNASSLPKKYISVAKEEDVWEESEPAEGEDNLLSQIFQKSSDGE